MKVLEEDASKISLDGTTLDRPSVLWIALPRFYARGTYLALYVGADEEIIDALESIPVQAVAGTVPIYQ